MPPETIILPGADIITGPPLLPLPLSEVLIAPIEMLPGEDEPPGELKPPVGTLGGFANWVKPARKIRAGLVFKI